MSSSSYAAAPSPTSPATAAARWRRCTTTSPAARDATRRSGRRNERQPHLLVAPHQRHGAAPPLSPAGILAARPRAGLLAHPLHGGLGLHHPVPGDQQQLGGASRRGAALRRAAVGG